jgi:hypothetical protein
VRSQSQRPTGHTTVWNPPLAALQRADRVAGGPVLRARRSWAIDVVGALYRRESGLRRTMEGGPIGFGTAGERAQESARSPTGCGEPSAMRRAGDTGASRPRAPVRRGGVGDEAVRRLPERRGSDPAGSGRRVGDQDSSASFSIEMSSFRPWGSGVPQVGRGWDDHRRDVV